MPTIKAIAISVERFLKIPVFPTKAGVIIAYNTPVGKSFRAL